jgi:hypothetical protein
MSTLEERVKMLEDTVYGPRVEPTPVVPPPMPVPVTPPQPQVPADFAMTPYGRMFPRPRPDLGEMFMGYTTRVGEYIGGEIQIRARNNAAGLFISATPLFAKFGGYRADGANWPAACEEWLFGDPNFIPDPAWGGYRPGR